MSGRMERRLLSLRRRVARDREDAYQALWTELAAIVTADGSHAWRFAARSDRDLHLEFLEFDARGDPRERQGPRRLLERLEEEIGAAVVEEWLEER